MCEATAMKNSRLAGTGRTRPNAETRVDQSPSRRLVSLAEAAELLGLSVASIRRLVRAGTLPAVRLTRRIQIDLQDVNRLVEQAKDRRAW